MTSNFLGLEFEPITLEHKAVLQEHLRRFPQRISGYTFASLAAWAEPYGFEWSRAGDDCVLICRLSKPSGERHLLQPIGVVNSDWCARLLAEARKLNYALKMLSVAKDFLDRHGPLCDQFTAEEDRSGANYIYLARDLAELSGRRYAKKRNLITQFSKLYPDWTATPLDPRCGPPCVAVLLAMAHGEGVATDDSTLQAELKAVDFTMHHFEELEQRGMMIRIGDEPVAFSIFECVGLETAAVHFEKASREHKGLYQMINRETSRMVTAVGCHLINREEDLGDEGLRQAKLSYFPLDIYPVYNLTITGSAER